MNGDLAARVRRYAEHHPDATAAGVIGAVEDLAPPDREAIRAFLDDEAAEHVTEPERSGGADAGKNLSAAKSRNGNTPDGDGRRPDAVCVSLKTNIEAGRFCRREGPRFCWVTR